MKIEDIDVAIFHRKDPTKIEALTHNEHSFNLGKKELDDHFKIEFQSTSDQKFLVFYENKDGHHEHIEEKAEEKVRTGISMHRKLILVTIRPGGIAMQYTLEIKHENHHSLFCFLETKLIKIFLHSNGIPDSREIDRKKHQVFLNAIFSKMDESQL